MNDFDALNAERARHRRAIESLNAKIEKVCPHPRIQAMDDVQILADWECMECKAWLSSTKLDMSKYKPISKTMMRKEDVYYVPAM